MMQAATVRLTSLHQPPPPVASNERQVPASPPDAPPDLFHEIDSPRAASGTPGSDPAVREEPTSLDQLRRFAAGGFLFALMDATDQILVPHKAKLLGPAKAISLFSGTAKEQYWQVAPYLFQVDSDLLDWTVAKLWKEPWGIFALSKSKFEDLRLHFKKFLLVQLPDGKVWYFRYYDPRILKTYLPVCQPWELQKFFGPIRAFATGGGEDEKPTIVQGLKVPPASPQTDGDACVWWKIRPEHRVAFRKAAMENFISRVAEHVGEFFPEECKRLGDEGVRTKIAYCIKRAATYGIVTEPEVCKYVDIAFAFGRRFDQNPKFPWATRILSNRRMTAEAKLAYLLRSVELIAQEKQA
jgi:hypothetical protein